MRSLHTRSPFGRMQRIEARIRLGDYPNANTLAKELEVTPKTIGRDIDYMRNVFNLPIEYDEAEHGYYLTSDTRSYPALPVTNGELVALLIARDVIAQYRGTPYEKDISAAFSKLLLPLDEMRGSLPSHSHISFKIAVPATHELELFSPLAKALDDQLEITFDYRKLGDHKPAPRRVQPLHLAHREGRWYLVAHDLGRKDMRTFTVTRIKDLRLTERFFERPKDFSADRYFADAFGVRRGEGKHRVRIRFDPMAADDVRERFFHETQTFKPQPDGSLDLTLNVSDLLDIQRYVLQWGGHATAIEPPELCAQLKAAGQQIVEAHDMASAAAQPPRTAHETAPAAPAPRTWTKPRRPAKTRRKRLRTGAAA
jgi:predicted DNA-binding transcriptional regulator YafY